MLDITDMADPEILLLIIEELQLERCLSMFHIMYFPVQLKLGIEERAFI